MKYELSRPISACLSVGTLKLARHIALPKLVQEEDAAAVPAPAGHHAWRASNGLQVYGSMRGASLSAAIESIRAYIADGHPDEGGILYVAFRDAESSERKEGVVELTVFAQCVVVNTGGSVFLYQGTPDLEALAQLAAKGFERDLADQYEME